MAFGHSPVCLLGRWRTDDTTVLKELNSNMCSDKHVSLSLGLIFTENLYETAILASRKKKLNIEEKLQWTLILSIEKPL